MTPYLEVGGSYQEVLPGLFLIELPLPFSLGTVNVYLARQRGGWMLIDCGMDTEPCLEALTRALEGLEVEWTAIRRILVTHAHPDHCGLARKLVERSGAHLLMSVEEVEFLNEAASGSLAELERSVLADAGVPPDLAAAIDAAFSTVRQMFVAVQPDLLLHGGERFSFDAGEAETVKVQGHSPGHICLYLAAPKALIAGDQILENITPNIGWRPGHDALAEFLHSLELLRHLEIDRVFPAHGLPFQEHRDWIDRTRRHHFERCGQIEAALAAEPKTAHELTGDLWNRKLTPFHHRFAVFEVLAHLEYLLERGRVQSMRLDGALRWSAVL